jgi:hypothetical protein
MKMKVGMGLMALGVGVWAAWSGWTRTRTVEPLDVRVTVVAGQSVEEKFKLNYDGLYLIEITAKGASLADMALGKIDAEWTLWSCGQEVKRGTTAEAHSAPGGSGGAARVIGEFNGRAGQSYELDVKFGAVARDLQGAKPRLRVAVSGLARENLAAASVLVFSTMFICELFGIILVGVGMWGQKRSL